MKNKPNITTPSKAYLDMSETQILENSAKCLRDRLLIRILRKLGCRISEAVGLEVDNIDFVKGTVTIRHLKTRVQFSCPQCNAKLGKSHSFCPNCGTKVAEAVKRELEQSRFRILPIDSDTLKMFRNYIDRGGPVCNNGKMLIFGINRFRAWQIIRECAERAGLGILINQETGKKHGVSPHRLRDSFAINAVQQDDSTDGIKMLQQWLGHANISTTMNYRKIEGKELKDWYAKLMEKT